MDWREEAGKLKGEFDRDGYVVLRGFFSPEEVREANLQVERFIAEVLPGLPPQTAFYEVKDDPGSIMRLQGMDEHSEYFRKLNYGERFVGLAELLLDDEVEVKTVQWFTKPARVGKETPPHQDGFYFKLEPSEALTLWLALDVVNEENGCVRFVSGSNRRGMRPHQLSNVLGFSQGIVDYGEADNAAEVAIHADPGDLSVHHCMTIHRADPNPSERPRRALGFVYYAKRATSDPERGEAYQKAIMEKWAREGKI